MTFRACSRCPDRPGCSSAFYAGLAPDCAAAKARAAMRAVSADSPMTLAEAAGAAVRHWELLRERGFDAAITRLRRVLERTGSPP